jgi:carbonic anhydrase
LVESTARRRLRRWHFIKWHTIAKQEESVLQDVRRIRASARSTQHPIYGYVYDVKTGRLNEVAKATEAGRAT